MLNDMKYFRSDCIGVCVCVRSSLSISLLFVVRIRVIPCMYHVINTKRFRQNAQQQQQQRTHSAKNVNREMQTTKHRKQKHQQEL